MNEKRFIKVLWLVKAALLVVLAYAGLRAVTGHLSIRAFNPGTVSGSEQTPTKAPVAANAQSPADYSAILRANLFSAEDTPGVQTPLPRSQVLDTLPSAEELGLRLVGAIAGGPAVSRANIRNTRDNTTGVYRIGDTVASATIETIQQDAVILRHEGRQLVLRLHTGAPDDSQPSGMTSQPSAERPAPAAERTNLSSIKADYVAEVFRQATIEPYVKNNRTEGLRITGLDKIPMAGMFGLRDGDVIQNINGQQLTSKQKAFQILMKARTQSRVDIQLSRDGKTRNLSFDL